MKKGIYITKKYLRLTIKNSLLNNGFNYKRGKYSIIGEISKQKIRDIHRNVYQDNLRKSAHFIKTKGSSLISHFASGCDVCPESIAPELIEVKTDTKEAALFKFASLLWSVPVSPGYGRRMRFLVKDKQNGKLIGLLALGDPVFNLAVRDNYIGWTGADRKEELIHIMDAFVCGAVPPYSQLIGGKLVAALLGSKEIQEVYNRKYLNSLSIISRKRKNATLAAITTTSALGRSSIYNRLKIPNGPIFTKIGMTKGYGHFHISNGLFEMMQVPPSNC